MKSVKQMIGIAILLFSWMIALPTPASAEAQAWGTEQQQMMTPYTNPVQVPMKSPNATKGLMFSGSKYTAVIGNEIMDMQGQNTSVTTSTGPRRVEGWPGIPFPDPIGDALLPLMLLALAFAIYKVRRRTRVE